jgi:hypothetical protein
LKAEDLLNEISEFRQEKYHGNSRDHFFIVDLLNLRSLQDVLLDVPAVKTYLSQTAPVPFDRNHFIHSDKIEKGLREKILGYNVYYIYVNGEQLFKPYRDRVKISKKQIDNMREIRFFEFKYEERLLAFGWVAGLKYLGMINEQQGIEGIRLRSGNIMIGDKNIFADFFRERRFNNYLVGEIHAANTNLVLNARRDDFEDNPFKGAFYNSFVREIGIPYSQKIRSASVLRSLQQREIRESHLLTTTNNIIQNGVIADAQRKKLTQELQRLFQNETCRNEQDKIIHLIHKVNGTKHFLDLKETYYSPKKKGLLKKIYNIVYDNCTNKGEVENIIRKINKVI